MNELVRDIAVPKNWDRRGLPGWCYHSDALLELEKEHVFRSHWQIACHVSDVPEPGSYVTFDMVGERILVLRDKEGRVRAFNNVCRHRGSRLVTAEAGHCRGALVCPFHGWVYNLDGTLRGPSRPDSFPPLDKHEFALAGIETEVWLGFVFIRLKPGPQASVAETMSPFEAELSHYQSGEMIPAGGFWGHESPVNWKSVRDVDNEGYHVAMAHPSLQDLYGSSYFDEPFVAGVCRSFATYNPHAGRRWSVRQYRAVAPEATHLPAELRQAWIYYGLFPINVIAVTPESVQFYQEFPITRSRTQLRGAIYRYRDEGRGQRLARYLAARIDRDTMAEDVQLTVWSNEAMTSRAYARFYLSDLEYGVRSHHDHLRAVLPVMTLDEAPEEEGMAETNARMSNRI